MERNAENCIISVLFIFAAISLSIVIVGAHIEIFKQEILKNI
tara:strand:+ start:281 stop:406 length:126 start_codon:yes stop_codon:yes gene_type:complete